MNDPVDVVEVGKPLEHRMCDPSDNLNVNRTDFFVNPIKGTLVHELHADADVGIRKECAEERNDVFRMAIMHDV